MDSIISVGNVICVLVWNEKDVENQAGEPLWTYISKRD
jgi:hypothetical protein